MSEPNKTQVLERLESELRALTYIQDQISYYAKTYVDSEPGLRVPALVGIVCRPPQDSEGWGLMVDQALRIVSKTRLALLAELDAKLRSTTVTEVYLVCRKHYDEPNEDGLEAQASYDTLVAYRTRETAQAEAANRNAQALGLMLENPQRWKHCFDFYGPSGRAVYDLARSRGLVRAEDDDDRIRNAFEEGEVIFEETDLRELIKEIPVSVYFVRMLRMRQ